MSNFTNFEKSIFGNIYGEIFPEMISDLMVEACREVMAEKEVPEAVERTENTEEEVTHLSQEEVQAFMDDSGLEEMTESENKGKYWI